ncbi:MarR family transcriptional regulator [Microbacterium sp. zg.Y1090]|uniref:MarR family winged helix-turn-helix transcriptional regulator n=1 Tax=Microbacterium TaxID=33882 RepID=UPI00214AB2D1|nr:MULTISPECIES: MarR family transcriptional regulator [unclassified Microbacterium]MCR2812381.1 MarR family transcriptional regulator [Microbacterium sp. zg.Y1084]MCR2817818.1 MarR family transcriptional regulator [Microbacterium sp. zg.Y1090]MDL5485538.1 MarR family transcriptional regulator [Microbacterium sp. zg-Y1211]WIM28709.1 MarR family transcriptional regulator [Microbacterium sp. zg-Y1090]
MPQTVVRHENEHLYADPPEREAGRALSDAILRLRRAERGQERRATARSTLSGLDLTALRYLVQGARDERDLSPKDLLTMLSTSSATITNVVERLVCRGLVERVQHPRDRRAHYLVPTPAAFRLVDEAYASHHSAIVEVIDGLTDQQADAAALVIARLAERLDLLEREERIADAEAGLR